MDYLVDHITWMAWTWQTIAFFGAIAAGLVIMTTLAVTRPETPRRGILGFSTTRGDRFFVSLLLAAFTFLIFLKVGTENPLYPAATAVLLAGIMFRFA